MCPPPLVFGAQKKPGLDRVKWLTSYLSERQISIRVGSTMSEYKTISCGVPRGSHLGPVFLSYLSTTFLLLLAFPLKFMLMALPCTMSTANSLYVQHIQLHRGRSIAPKSGLNLDMANLVMQSRDVDPCVDQQRNHA